MPLTDERVDIVLAKKSQISWPFPVSQAGKRHSPAVREMSESELENSVGYVLSRYRSNDGELMHSFLVEAVDTYYAEMGPGAILAYRTRSGLTFFLEQQAIVKVHQPSMYIYPDDIDASMVQLGTLDAVLVVPPMGSNFASFVEWFPAGRRVSLLFDSRITKNEMIAIARATS